MSNVTNSTRAAVDYKYYATAGSADINLVTDRPGYANRANTGDTAPLLPRKICVYGDGNLTITDVYGNAVTMAITAPWSAEISPVSITQATTTATKILVLW